MDSVGVRTYVGHDPALEYHEWITFGDRVKANRLGWSNPRMWEANWTRWTCNNTECPAMALVHDDAIVALLPPTPTQAQDFLRTLTA